MTHLILACVAFVGLHVVLSGTSLRDKVAGRLGEPAFLGLFSAIALVTIVWASIAYGNADHVEIWLAGPALKGIAWLIMVPAVLFVVCGNVTPNPSAVGSEKLLERDDIAKGIFTITRHPLMWGIALWAFAHLLANGDVASLILFGSMLVLVLVGVPSQERKKRRKTGGQWDRFAQATSSVPFAAILQGRTRLDGGGIGFWRVALSAAVYAVFVLLHPWIIGVAPIPY
ncbi:MAG: NnrU family protein [Rhodospirillales bacterium]|nr:NnrU family protein [Rhodospirillales bacterium]